MQRRASVSRMGPDEWLKMHRTRRAMSAKGTVLSTRNPVDYASEEELLAMAEEAGEAALAAVEEVDGLAEDAALMAGEAEDSVDSSAEESSAPSSGLSGVSEMHEDQTAASGAQLRSTLAGE